MLHMLRICCAYVPAYVAHMFPHALRICCAYVPAYVVHMLHICQLHCTCLSSDLGLNTACCSMDFTSQHLLTSRHGLHTLKPRVSDYEPSSYVVYVPPHAFSLQLGVIKQTLLAILLALLPMSEQLHDLMNQIQIRAAPSQSLTQVIGNFASTVKRDDLVILAAAALNDRCPCLDGPYSGLVDLGIGHVCTMDLSAVLGDSALLALRPGGNFRLAPAYSYASHRDALLFIWQQAIDCTHAAQCYDAVLDHTDSFKLFYRMFKDRIPRSDYRSANYKAPSVEAIQHAQEHLMFTCIDKVNTHLIAVCIHWAALQVVTHLYSPCYSITGVTTEYETYVQQLAILFDNLGLSVHVPDCLPYVYPTIKMHKCADHDPLQPHECGITTRKITADVNSSHTWLGCITSAILGVVKQAILEHRHQLQTDFESQHGFTLRFFYWVTSWQTVALNLPTRVNRSHRFINCDVKKCFDNIPLQGPDGLLQIITHPINEAYDFTLQSIYIALDQMDEVIPKSSCFATNMPWCGTDAKVRKWLKITRSTAHKLIQLYLTTMFVSVGSVLARQTMGIPMGGSPSSHLLDLYLDHYEYRWARTINVLTQTNMMLARQWAEAMQYFFRYADDAMGIVPPWLLQLMVPTRDRPTTSHTWLYPLLDAEGNTILEFDIEDALVFTINFLCLTLTIQQGDRQRNTHNRTIVVQPYTKAIKFNFELSRLTHWHSYTTRH